MPRSSAFLPAPLPKPQASSHTPARCAVPTSRHTSANPPLPPRPSRGSKRATARFHSLSIASHAKAGDLPAMQLAVRQATQAGVVLNAVNYTAIANAHAEHGNPAHVFNVLARMREAGVAPTNVTLRVAVKAAAAWRGRPAVQALRVALAWVAERGTDPPDARSWNLALAALSRKEAVSDVKEVLAWMRCGAVGGMVRNRALHRIPNPTSCSYNTCLLALGRQGKFEEAIHLFGEMLVRKGARDADDGPDVITYNTILDLAVSARRWPFRTEIDARQVRPLHQPVIFVSAVESSMRRQRIEPNITTETLALRLLTRKQAAPPEAGEVWKRCRRVLGNTRKFQPDKRVRYNTHSPLLSH